MKVLSKTTVQNLIADKPRDPKIQERIRDYHGFLEATLGSEDFGTSLYGYESFINNYEYCTEKGDPNEY